MPVVATTDKPAYARVMLTGAPGTGKTLFPSSLPALYLDIEGRAGHTGRPRLLFTKDGAGIQDIQNTLTALARLKPDDDGMLTFSVKGENPIKFNTLVYDSLDETQLMMDYGWPKGGDMRQWWGRALSVMQNIITSLKMCQCHVFVVAHAKEYMPDEAQQRSGIFVPEVKLALSGQIRDRAPRWFDTILHLMPNPQSGNVNILTQPKVIGGRVYLAKDATHIFEGKTLLVKFENGKPNPGDVQKIVDSTSGGGDVSMFTSPDTVLAQAQAEAEQRHVEAEQAFNPALIATWDELMAQAAHRMSRYEDVHAVQAALEDMTGGDGTLLSRYSKDQWWQKLIHYVETGSVMGDKKPVATEDSRENAPGFQAEPELSDLEDGDTGADPEVGAEVEEAEADEPIVEVEGPVVEKPEHTPDAVRVALLQKLPVTSRLYRESTPLADILLTHDEEANGPAKDVFIALRDWDTEKYPEIRMAAKLIVANWDEAKAHLSTPSYAKRPSAALPKIAPTAWSDFATFCVDAFGFLTVTHFLKVVEAVEQDKGRTLRNSRGRKQVWEGVYERWIATEVAIPARPGSELDKALGREESADPAATEEEALQAAGL